MIRESLLADRFGAVCCGVLNNCERILIVCAGGWKISLTLKCDSTSLIYTRHLLSYPIDYNRIVVVFEISKTHLLFKFETSKVIVKFSYTLGLVL